MRQVKIAAFVPTYTMSLASVVYQGVQSAIDNQKKKGVDLQPYFFDGGPLTGLTSNSSPDFIYQYGKSSFFDGVLIFGGIVGYSISQEELEEYCRGFGDTPVVNIAMDLDGTPSVLIDDYAGMYSLTEHMISFHAYRKPFFICGRKGHQQADTRLNAFKDCLEKYAVPFHPEALYSGEFTSISGEAAADFLFSGTSAYRPDCVIAANDEMAYGFIQRSQQKYGISFPADMAVAGYDNADFSSALHPLLTTVDQPFFHMTEVACDELVRRIQSPIENNKNRVITPELVLRESCGCADQDAEDMSLFLSGSENKILFDFDLLQSKLDISVLDTLTDILIQEIHSRKNILFIEKFSAFVEAPGRIFSENEQRGIVHYLGKSVLKRVPDCSRDHLSLFLLQVQKIFQKSLYRRERELMVGKREKQYLMSVFEKNLEKISDMDELKAVLEPFADDLKVHNLIYFLFSGENNKDKASVFFAYLNGKRVSSLEKTDLLEIDALLAFFSDRMVCRGNYMFSPFVSGNEIFGFGLYDVPSQSLSFTHDVSHKVSSFIQNYQLRNEAEIKKRELEKSVLRLRNIRSKLLDAEKQAALGKLIAGISHEINTPMGNGITAVSFMQSRLDEINSLMISERLKKSDLVYFLQKSGELSDILMKNLQKVARLLENFKQIDIDAKETEPEDFYLQSVIDDALSYFSHSIVRKEIRVYIQCPKDLSFSGDRDIFITIFKALIDNTLEHGFRSSRGGNINIMISRKDSRLIIIFEDDGEGIPPGELSHIFDPFFTTGLGDGSSGLGLHIVYLLVTSKLGGTIEVESTPEDKTIFTLNLPVDLTNIENIPDSGDQEDQETKDDLPFGSFSDLADQLVHDLNTPLGVSISLLSLMNDSLEGKNSTPVSDISSQLYLNLERIRETLQNFKDVCSDNEDIELQVIPLKEYIEGIIGSLSTLLKEKKVSVKLSCPSNTFIKAPSILLFRVMSNLITNSLFHAFPDRMENRLLEITITREGAGITILYQDNGRGIPQDLLEHIAKPYFTTGKKKGRTGLGMFIINKLVSEYFNGTISCGNRAEGGFICRIDFEPEFIDM